MAQESLTASKVRRDLLSGACGVLGVVPVFLVVYMANPWWVIGIAFGLSWGGMIWFAAWDYRCRRRLRAKQFRVCTKCGYDLSAHEPAGNCPECGTHYTYEAIKRKWLRRYPTPLFSRRKNLSDDTATGSEPVESSQLGESACRRSGNSQR
jgi:predicted RNA-binding Zn-ribbon protein involved in translation (DUF1610 family)